MEGKTDCMTLTARPKKVGNSMAVFIDAKTRKYMGISEKDELIIHLHKKKKKSGAFKGLLALAGATKGKLGPWVRAEDRSYGHRDE